jgi:hypothetical protein
MNRASFCNTISPRTVIKYSEEFGFSATLNLKMEEA